MSIEKKRELGRYRSLILSTVLLAILVHTGRYIYSALWTNTGFLLLNSATGTIIWQQDGSGADRQRRAFLRAASAENPYLSAWRGLGFTYVVNSEEKEAAVAWSHHDGMAGELMAWARQAEDRNQTDEAMARYLLAAAVAPSWADPWYFRGILLELEGNQAEARLSYEHGLTRPERLGIGESDLKYRLGRVATAADVPAWSEAEAHFNDALEIDDFSSGSVRAKTIYARGEARQWTNDPKGAIADFERTLALMPDHYWARVHLGLLLWEEQLDIDRAESLWSEAIALDPGPKWPFRNLGDLYAATGDIPEAIEAYENVLLRDPDDPHAISQLARLQD